MCLWFCAKGTGANGAGLGVFGPVQKVPVHVFLDCCKRYRFMCLRTGAKGTSLCIFGPVRKLSVYVFLNRGNDTGLCAFESGLTIPVYVFLNQGKRYRFMCF